ncbi:MAG TPA: LytTR family DNA-binding domain-containing protein [Thermodesulfobacteriota bacterium]
MGAWRCSAALAASLVCEAGSPMPVAPPPGPRALRLLVVGCRLLTESVDPVLDGYRGLATFEVVHCDVAPHDLDGHVDEAPGGAPPHAAEAMRHADAVLLPPAPHAPVPAEPPVVRIELAPSCVVELLREARRPGTTPALVLPADAVPRLLVAAWPREAADAVLLTYLGAEHLHAQLDLVARSRLAPVLADPAAAALARRRGLEARSIYDGAGRCLVVHALERGLAQASLARLSGLAHGPAAAPGSWAAPSGWPPSHPAGRRPDPVRDVVALRTARRFVLVPAASISYISSRGGLVTAYTDRGSFWSDRTLAEVESRLDPRRFVRLDASRLVNVARVVELIPWTHQRYKLRLDDAANTELVLSRDVGRRLRAILGW